ncbi:phage baseplate upper protein [Enterococcus faecium]|uniref:phage baseplate upper protein n=2 Tax=Enterococcus faecium TaxID=1352 RepID=UPI000F4FBEC6|nr:phage baseplate upper protein [Enterococcus faecium]MDQ8291670.1 BppU family phage baseplate upper protein [Enterococcus faecium]ROX61190.1 phage baseplate upper protein [Enterococcus faecium]ROX62819.1 phage baseplate upper protein [Enterococcus faecium]ROY23528.1 phage baseplate upper protein [Enterococcus faecium]ROY57337.1 phage baseplate upper protein [Enterococcus faecium]
MKFKKIGRMKVCTKVKGKNEQDTGLVFYSYDRGSSALEFLFRNQDYQITDLTNTTFKILLTIMQDGQEKKFTAIDSQPIIENPESGIVTYPLPEQLLNHEGEVKGYVYLDFEDGSHSDEIAFTFTVIRSKIDSEIEEASEVYIKDFEQIKKEVFDLAGQAKEDIESLRPELEASVGQLTEQVQSLSQKVEINQSETNRLLQLIADNELLTVKEILVALSRGYFEFRRKVDYVGKIKGSMKENPHYLWQDDWSPSRGYEMPSPLKTHSEVYETGYEGAKAIGGKTYGGSISNGNNNLTTYQYMACSQWDIIEDIKRWLGEDFFSIFEANTLSEQAEFVGRGIACIRPELLCKGEHFATISKGEYGPREYKVTGAWFDVERSEWIDYCSHEEKNFTMLNQEVLFDGTNKVVDPNGKINISIYSASDNNSGVSYDYLALNYTYRIYLSDILYYKRDPTIDQMQTQIQQLWNEVFKN